MATRYVIVIITLDSGALWGGQLVVLTSPGIERDLKMGDQTRKACSGSHKTRMI